MLLQDIVGIVDFEGFLVKYECVDWLVIGLVINFVKFFEFDVVLKLENVMFMFGVFFDLGNIMFYVEFNVYVDLVVLECVVFSGLFLIMVLFDICKKI